MKAHFPDFWWLQWEVSVIEAAQLCAGLPTIASGFDPARLHDTAKRFYDVLSKNLTVTTATQREILEALRASGIPTGSWAWPATRSGADLATADPSTLEVEFHEWLDIFEAADLLAPGDPTPVLRYLSACILEGELTVNRESLPGRVLVARDELLEAVGSAPAPFKVPDFLTREDFAVLCDREHEQFPFRLVAALEAWATVRKALSGPRTPKAQLEAFLGDAKDRLELADDAIEAVATCASFGSRARGRNREKRTSAKSKSPKQQ